MVSYYKSDELYRIAIQMERNGLAFYSEVAHHTASEPVRAVYEYLAKSEKKHLSTFKKLLGSKPQQAPESYRGEYVKYLRVLLRDRIFPTSAIARSRAAKSGVSAALRTGINAEKDSILFYQELLDHIPETDRTSINKILREEKRHLRKLVDYKETGCIG